MKLPMSGIAISWVGSGVDGVFWANDGHLGWGVFSLFLRSPVTWSGIMKARE